MPPVVFGEESNEVLVRGRIDRIDKGQRNDEQAGYNIIDYKTGVITKFDDQLKNAHKYQLQLALYGVAAVRLGIINQLSEVNQLGYWEFKEKGFTSGRNKKGKIINLDLEFLENIECELDRLIPLIVDHIRQGQFDVYNKDEKCGTHCRFRTICRIKEVRQQPENLQKLFEIDPANSN